MEFFYDNSYQASHELVQRTVETVQVVQERLQATQSGVDISTTPTLVAKSFEFAIGDHIFLRVSPLRGVIRFGPGRKLNTCYIQIGCVAYSKALPQSLSQIHGIFHMSQLQKYVRDPNHAYDIFHHYERI